MNRSQGYVLLATLGLSFILIFSTWLMKTGMSSFEQVLLRLSLSLLILLSIMLFRRRLHFVRRKDVPFFLAIGFTYALFSLSGLSGVAFGTANPVIVALVYTQPIYTALISWLTRKEKVSSIKASVLFLGVVGALLVSGIQVTSTQIHLGIILPALCGFFYAVYLWLKRQVPTGEYTPYQVLFSTFMFAIPFLFIVWLVLRNFSENSLLVGTVTPNITQLVLLVFFAVFGTVLPYGLLNYVKVEEVSPTTEGLLLLTDPVLLTIWSVLFFGQLISGIQYLGAVLILASSALNLKIGTQTSSKR